MKNRIFKRIIIFCTVVFFFGSVPVFAVSVILTKTSDPRVQEVSIQVSIDPESDKLNAYGGQIDYDKSHLYLKKIDTSDSVVSAWVTYPEKDNSTTGEDSIFFEGITQGGFSGLIIPDSQKKVNGKLFTLIFSVEKEGKADVAISQLHVYKDDGNATEVPTSDVHTELSLSKEYVKNSYFLADYAISRKENIDSQDIYLIKATTSDLYGGKTFVVFENLNKQKSLKNFEVSESLSQNPRNVPDFSWTEAKSPYLLTQSGLTKYIHVRANYIDGSYSYQTLTTVENNTEDDSLSYILMLVTLLSITIYYVVSLVLKKE